MSEPIVTAVDKRGEAYYVRGLVGDRRASFVALAQDVEAMSREDFQAFCKRQLPDVIEGKRWE